MYVDIVLNLFLKGIIGWFFFLIKSNKMEVMLIEFI